MVLGGAGQWCVSGLPCSPDSGTAVSAALCCSAVTTCARVRNAKNFSMHRDVQFNSFDCCFPVCVIAPAQGSKLPLPSRQESNVFRIDYREILRSKRDHRHSARCPLGSLGSIAHLAQAIARLMALPSATPRSRLRSARLCAITTRCSGTLRSALRTSATAICR